MQLVLLMPQERTDEERVERYLAAGHVRRGSAHLAPRLRSAAGGLQRDRVPVVVGGRPPGAGIPYVDVDNRGGARRGRAAPDRSAAHGGSRRSPGRRTWPPARTAWPAITSAAGPAGGSGDELVEIARLHPRWRPRRDGAAARARAASTRSSSHPTSWRSARWPRSAPPGARSPVTWPSSASTTRRWRATTQPILSSVRQPIEEMGREMARLLMQEIQSPGAAPRRVILDTQLVVRGSSVVPNGR